MFDTIHAAYEAANQVNKAVLAWESDGSEVEASDPLDEALRLNRRARIALKWRRWRLRWFS
jgi:hypothetical protein